MCPVNPKRNILVDSFSTSGLRYREAYSALFFVCLFFSVVVLPFFFSLFFSSVSHRWKKNVKYMSLSFPLKHFLTMNHLVGYTWAFQVVVVDERSQFLFR